MNNIVSRIVLIVAGLILMRSGIDAQGTLAGNESSGQKTSLIAENIRTRGGQNLGLGVGLIGFGLMPLSTTNKKDDD